MSIIRNNNEKIATFTRIPNDQVCEDMSHHNIMSGAVFAPSGRWAIDLDRKVLANRRTAIHLNVIDMAKSTIQTYNAFLLEKVQNVINLYWVSDSEFVIVDLDVRIFKYISIFCHLDHKSKRAIPFRGISSIVPLENLSENPNIFRIQRNIGAEPVEFMGEKFYLINNSKDLVLVPWNLFYSENTSYRMSLEIDFGAGKYACSRTVFPYGSSLYIPVNIYCPTHRAHISTKNIIRVDLEKLDFEDRFTHLELENPAVSIIRLKQLNKQAYDAPDEKVYFKQIGHQLVGYSKKHYIPNEVIQEEVKERSLFILNLKEHTVSYQNVNASHDYFPTIYRGSLLIFDHVRVGENKWKMQCQRKILGNTISSLQGLSHLSLFTKNIKIHSDFNNILYPLNHCCPINTKNCMCRGVLKSVYAEALIK